VAEVTQLSHIGFSVDVTGIFFYTSGHSSNGSTLTIYTIDDTDIISYR
jgi:hypothetical protein